MRTIRRKGRKYIRKCGVCGELCEQTYMIRANHSPNGWLCLACHLSIHPEYDIDKW